MDSYFKAAVCDLDKLLDDFELSSEDLDYRPAVQTCPAGSEPFHHSGNCLQPQCFTAESPPGPDLKALHCFPSAPSNSQNQREHGLNQTPLTGVDLLSSVDGRASESLTPPCPDRALKPVCDLVNDTGSAILQCANSHDAFKELEDAEKRLDEELLVDFDSPVVVQDNVFQTTRDDHLSGAGSLSLLDVILPAAVVSDPQDFSQCSSKPMDEHDAEELQSNSCMEGSASPTDEATVVCSVDGARSVSPSSDGSKEYRTEEIASSSDVGAISSTPDLKEVQDSSENLCAEEPECLSASPSAEKAPSLSCIPMAVSMCGSLVTSSDTQETVIHENTGKTEASCAESKEKPSNQEPSESLSSGEVACPDTLVRQDSSREDDSEALQLPVKPEEQSHDLSDSSDRILKDSLPPAEETVYSSFAEDSHSPAFDGISDYSEFKYESEYLSTGEDVAMVTDEELDAYLSQVGAFHSEVPSEKVVGDNFSELNGDLESEGILDGLRNNKVKDNSLSEDDHSFGFAEENEHGDAPFSSQDVAPSTTEDAQTDISNPEESQSTCNANQQLYFGGARPKQTSNQTARSPPAVECQRGSAIEEGMSSPVDNLENDTQNSLTSPTVGQTGDFERSGSGFPPQYECEYRQMPDELSEPPPYPGEKPREGSDELSGMEGSTLGSRQPAWVPDSEAPNCMKCGQKFTFTKRRHHCRACGKVYCATCCNRKCRLKYLEREARVCVVCHDTIQKAQAHERMMSPTGPSPNPNIPSEYCSTIPPMQQARASGTLNSPPPTVMVPVSVLKHPGNDGFPREQKHVWFADGILPNGEVADTTKLSMRGRRSSQESSPVTPDPPVGGDKDHVGFEDSVGEALTNPESPAEAGRPPVSGPWDYALLCGVAGCVQGGANLVPEDDEGLPPLLIITGEDDGGDLLLEERPAACQILLLLEEGGPRPLTFVLNANLLVNVKLVNYNGKKCWCFSSVGLQGVGQRELVFVIECLPEENSLPRDMFDLYVTIYQDAQRGKFIEDLGNLTFTDSFLGSKDHAGFLFFSPTFQPLEGLSLPPGAFLYGVLIQKLEVPWAKVFPLRLLLRLGTEYNMYPSALVSVRYREAVYKETGHTIMNLLADLRNYQYTLPVVEGLRIHMEVGNSYIDIPKSKFSEMLKVVNASNEHVISVGACFSTQADSHLVCFQNKEGNYQTQANSVQGKTRKVTGASFVVFNGALKASSGFIAKSSIVEDGLMVQIPPDTMESLRQALRDQADFQIPCGKADSSEARENVTVRWVDWTVPVNAGMTSPIDGKSLEGVSSVKVQQESEFECDGRTIRCTEVFYLLKSPDCSLPAILPSCSQFQREIGTAGCAALCPHLSVLTRSGINSLGLRVSTDTDMVEYQAGCGGKLLPQKYMNELDGALIPVIHGGSSAVPHQAMDMEFIFYITQIM
ncbi:zinc finger FYVE domain-containing protein 16 [Chanos chanos]|uniref:Zinc finger FYVE domain-containing protein n=1 Tax=Chanos chanos TaxID=29144 RepID=A0A6J2UYT2_CHACN|nr:zinc finger FYVE domain-containing protein 16-like [Chanos chanos]